MTYNILGINPGHNGSAALTIDGELVYYVEEERLSRVKYDGNPFRAMLDIMSKWKVDEIIIGGTTDDLPELPWTMEDPYSALVRKFYPNVKISNFGADHHISHAACSFYNSGFDKAISIVVDGAGSYKSFPLGKLIKMGQYKQTETDSFVYGFESESIFVFEYPAKITLVKKSFGSNDSGKYSNDFFDFGCGITTAKAYEGVSDYLGFGYIEAGKTMGLSSYGKEDPNIQNLFIGNRGDKNIFIPNYPAGSTLTYPENNPKEWHNNSEKLTEFEKNLAWKVQQETQEKVGDLIQFAIEKTGINNVCLSGGYGLNCVANYYLKKRFPDINLYCEPAAHDGGTAVGLAKYGWYRLQDCCGGGCETHDQIKKHPQKTLYHGPEYHPEYIKQMLFQYKDDIIVNEVSYDDVAKLISERNIVSLYQGRSEAGPRALGNRSIIYDPRDPNGKDFVNTVKGREWFRPFAGSILEECANDWFDMAGLESSPFMMYAVDVLKDKIEQIPNITHVDGTCRIQTVNPEQNLHYYNLIKAFRDITEVPILFNTSFNLAGDPLVETIFDAMYTIFNSKINYLYLPELGILVEKKSKL